MTSVVFVSLPIIALVVVPVSYAINLRSGLVMDVRPRIAFGVAPGIGVEAFARVDIDTWETKTKVLGSVLLLKEALLCGLETSSCWPRATRDSRTLQT